MTPIIRQHHAELVRLCKVISVEEQASWYVL